MSGPDQGPCPLPALLRRAGLDTVEGAFACERGEDMTVADLGHRERWRLPVTDAAGRRHVLFMKRYRREPLTWRIQRWLTYGPGRGPARIELDNIHAAHAAGVGAIAQAVCGEQADALGVRRCYIVLSRVPGEALEQCFEPFLAACRDRADRVAEFTRLLVDLVRRFHGSGYVHRDLYTSHIFLHQRAGRIELRLIDLARMFRPRWRRFRWRVKDLAQLKFSMPAAWTRDYWSAFLDGYLGAEGAALRRRYERAIDRKVTAIARHDRRKQARRRRRAAKEQAS